MAVIYTSVEGYITLCPTRLNQQENDFAADDVTIYYVSLRQTQTLDISGKKVYPDL